ncbi:MAG TPA: class I SAM-dependent methyltransferase [Thermoanaerobaculia bacterium]|nr:class I SAM-dependent methyltransferase [Thermoanaerobaculia bacterium]
MWPELERLPIHMPWNELRERFVAPVREAFAKWITADQGHYEDQLGFAVGRLDEGAGLVRLFAITGALSRPADVLDIGSGNGGVAFAFANCRTNRVRTLDIVPNPQLRECRRELNLPVEAVVGDGGALPFATDSFDIVLLFDVFEHLPHPSDVGREVMRVLRPGGVCLVTTPARFNWLFRPDPHYGIRGLLLFPNEVQRFIVNRLFRRRIRRSDGQLQDAYDVEHTYWSAAGIAKHFPGPKLVDVIYGRQFQPPASLPEMWKEPSRAIDTLRLKLRFFQFEHLLIYKEMRPAGTLTFDPLPAG